MTAHEPSRRSGHDLLVLRGLTLPSGERADLAVREGRIAGIGSPGELSADAATLDARGWLALPALAEPHIHLDKALTVDAAPNRSGDLAGAIEAWIAHLPTVDPAELRIRARSALRRAALHGVTALRSHVDIAGPAPLQALETLLELRSEFRGVIDLQLIAGHGLPVTGEAGEANTGLLRRALELGADAVGGAPSLDDDPVGSWERLARIADDHGVPLDLHVDETLDPGVFLLDRIARDAPGLRIPLTVGHVVSLAAQPPRARRETAERLADAGVAVVTLPQTNLYLQGRDGAPLAPRGLTALDDLDRAGVTVAAGADNVGDPFNPTGRIDPLETASLLVTAGHRSADAALAAISSKAREAMGLPALPLAPGEPADFVLIRATSVADAIGRADIGRQVWRGGRLIAETETLTRWAGDAAPADDLSELTTLPPIERILAP